MMSFRFWAGYPQIIGERKQRVQRGSLSATILLWSAVCLGPVAFGQPDSATGSSAGQRNFLTDLRDDMMALPTWENAFWLLGGSLATWGAYEIEDAAGARRALDGGFINPLVEAGNIYGDLRFQVPLAFTIWGCGRFGDDEAVAGLGYDLVRALSLNYAVTGTMKPVFNRTRPNGESHSFPSGHSSAVFATAGVVSRHHGPWVTGAAIWLGVVTGLGRMEDMKHYASDVTAGATLGWIIGRTVARKGPPARQEVADGDWQITPSAGGAVLSRRF